MATYFPEEVISQILLRVHARDLIRIKTVCKLWHSLISNLNFVNAHLARSHPEIILTTCRYHSSEGREDIYDYISIDMQENDLPSKIFQFPASLHNKVYLIHSCNGLTLLQDRDDFPRLYIYNPVTRECNTLSPTQYKCHQWALAYDDSIRKYKVFGIASEKKVCLVLTQGENLWKEVRTIEDPFPVLRSNPVLVEKELCWFSRYMDSLNENIQRLYYVNSIDVATEEFRNIKIPPSITKLCHQLSAE
ncbi:hypothetical protein IFM89_025023 [Coptis chinensis]|uniref:F-box domain-containing protein n=1 Tax=Coptis chinensis TaxID=261450 RepID=A0A835LSX7_9MAGN|nr:hypothetical protein IFM89_025023 [Coptis chinensis]